MILSGTSQPFVARVRHISRASLGRLALRIGLLLAVAWFVLPAFLHAISVWSLDEEFTYGFLIPPLSLGLVWWRRAAIRASLGAGANAGLVLVVAGILLTLVSRRVGINAIAGVAVCPLLLGV